jgi:hypothetical protein
MGAVAVVIIWLLDLLLPIPITTDVMTWWFSLDTPVSSTNKTDLHDIAEILLKVALNNLFSYTTFTDPIHYLFVFYPI